MPNRVEGICAGTEDDELGRSKTCGWRIFAKGASEIILSRVAQRYAAGDFVEIDEYEANKITDAVISKFANMAMRTIGLADKDVGEGFDMDDRDESILDADGSPAFQCETELILLGIVGFKTRCGTKSPLRLRIATELASTCAW